MDLKNDMKDFRCININNYPELKNYESAEIYDQFIGCFGSASIYLAKNYGVTVIAVDLWFPPSRLASRIIGEDYSNKIIPLNMDITQHMPFAENYFDAIFCMNSLFLYGDNLDFLKRLLGTLKQDGTFCIGSECFSQEPDFGSKENIPEVFNFSWNWDVWDSCGSKYHSPKWWHSLLNETDLLNIIYCQELDDGRVLWEDLALNYYSYISKDILSMGAVISQDKLVQQINYGNTNLPYLTLFILAGIKK